MRTKKTSNSRKKRDSNLLVIVPAILLLGGAILFGLEKANITDFVKKPDTVIPGAPTAEEKAQDAKINADNKQQLVEAEAQAATNKNTTTPAATSSQKIDLSGHQEDNGTVTVFTKLYGYSSGTCTLTTTNGSKKNTQTATLMYQPEYASCAGFSVPIGPLGSGTWNINLSVNSNGATTTKSISFEVN